MSSKRLENKLNKMLKEKQKLNGKITTLKDELEQQVKEIKKVRRAIRALKE